MFIALNLTNNGQKRTERVGCHNKRSLQEDVRAAILFITEAFPGWHVAEVHIVYGNRLATPFNIPDAFRVTPRELALMTRKEPPP